MLQLMQVPAWLLSAVEVGSAVVQGALVREVSSGRVLAHLQPTASMLSPLLGPAMNTALSGGGLLSSLVGNIQLLKVQRDVSQLKEMVKALELVSGIGAAAAVLNLGVSIAGFAMVIQGIKRVNAKVDALGRTMSAMSELHHAQHMGRCLRALEQAQEAYRIQTRSERLRYWREADSTLGELIEVGGQLMAKQGLAIGGPGVEKLSESDRLALLADPAVADSLRWMMTFSVARSEVLLCLGEPHLAAEVAGKSAEWLRPLPHDPTRLALASVGDQALPPSQIREVAQLSKATGTLVQAGRSAALSREEFARQLGDEGVDTEEAMMNLHRSIDPLLVWSSADEAPKGG